MENKSPASPAFPEFEPRPAAEVRLVDDSADFLAEIMGDETRAGQRMPAGPILKLCYDTALSVALRHSRHRPVLLRVDRMDLTRRVRHLDLLRVEGRLIEVGQSSMVVEVRSFCKVPTEREPSPAHVGFFTIVAMDDQGQPCRDLPRLSYDSLLGQEARVMSAHRRAELEDRRQALEWSGSAEPLRVEDVGEPDAVQRYDFLRPEETMIVVRGQLFSHGAHFAGRVKGGDLLMWLDRVATYTARQFTRNEHGVTISVNDVLLKRPLFNSDRIELKARVVYVRTHTLEVSIDIAVDTLQGERHLLDPVEFQVLNFDESGEKKRITTGLLLEDRDQEGLRRYLKARTRYAYWKSHPESHLIQSPM